MKYNKYVLNTFNRGNLTQQELELNLTSVIKLYSSKFNAWTHIVYQVAYYTTLVGSSRVDKLLSDSLDEYFKLTGENPQDYINKVKQITKSRGRR